MLGLKTGVCVLNKIIVFSKVDILRYYVIRMYTTEVLSFFGKCTEVNFPWLRAKWLVDWCSNE